MACRRCNLTLDRAETSGTEKVSGTNGTTKTPHEQESLKRQIDATDRQIDKLVYELYGLADSEIEIVEKKALSN